MAPIRRLKGEKPPVTASNAPSAADLDAVAAEEQTKAKTASKAETKPDAALSTIAAIPGTPEQPSRPGAAPESQMSASSFLPANPDVNWTDPKLNTATHDSMGNVKSDKYVAGPKGDSLPPDTQTPAERQAKADAHEQKLQQGMTPTVLKDSVGNPKGTFAVTPGGKTKKGVKLPDVVDYSKPIEPPAVHVGPRGIGAPQDTYHGPRPAKR